AEPGRPMQPMRAEPGRPMEPARGGQPQAGGGFHGTPAPIGQPGARNAAAPPSHPAPAPRTAPASSSTATRKKR
ncbi:MAG TPA: hypothetical protein VFG23_03300, partial [Polyangia bacterium]|nr:hypothetical protein [Polyangia bacterium]